MVIALSFVFMSYFSITSKIVECKGNRVHKFFNRQYFKNNKKLKYFVTVWIIDMKASPLAVLVVKLFPEITIISHLVAC
jgi:hypothetical protein